MTNYLETNFDLDHPQLVEFIDELPLWSAPFGLKLLEQLHYKKGIQALDIGYGTGFPLTELAMRLGATATVYGIDPWDAASDRLAKKLNQYGIRNVKLIRGTAENIPLNDQSIDLITSNNGINNVTDQEKVLAECARVMKPGAQLLQTMNLDETMQEFYSVLQDVLLSFDMEEAVDRMKEQIRSKRKPLNEYLLQLDRHGFMIEKVTHDRFDYRFVDGTALLHHYFIRLAFLDGWKSIVGEAEQENVFHRVEERLNEQAAQQGFCRLTIPFVVIDCRKK